MVIHASPGEKWHTRSTTASRSIPSFNLCVAEIVSCSMRTVTVTSRSVELGCGRRGRTVQGGTAAVARDAIASAARKSFEIRIACYGGRARDAFASILIPNTVGCRVAIFLWAGNAVRARFGKAQFKRRSEIQDLVGKTRLTNCTVTFNVGIEFVPNSSIKVVQCFAFGIGDIRGISGTIRSRIA